MNRNAIEKLAAAIGYPDEVPGGARSFAFLVDDGEVDAVLDGGALRLRRVVADADMAAELARLAPGRMLSEGAILACDPAAGDVFLWQETSAGADPAELASFFERFLNSCDWWRDMADTALPEAEAVDEFVIRP